MKSYRTEILEYNGQSSDINRGVVYPDGGMAKGETMGASSRRICPQSAQPHHAPSAAVAALGEPEPSKVSRSPQNQ